MKNLRTLQAENHQQKTDCLTSQLPIFFNKNIEEQEHEDINKCQTLLKLLLSTQQGLNKQIEQINKWVQQNQFQKGIGFYNCKNTIFVMYLGYLNFYKLFKINAVTVHTGIGLQLYKKLIYYKNLILKLAPTQKKLSYQTNKMLKPTIETVQVIENDNSIKKNKEKTNDPLSYRARPTNIQITNQIKSQKYIPPKLSAILPQNEKIKDRQQKKKQRRRAYLAMKFRNDMFEDQQVREQGLQNQFVQKINKKMEAKIRFQEENFVRLRETKKQKIWRKKAEKEYQQGDGINKQLEQIQAIRQLFQDKSKPTRK